MNQAQGRFHARIGQIEVELLQLSGGEHSLVYHRLRRQTGHIEKFATRRFGLGDGVGDALTDDVEFAFESLVVLQVGAAFEKYLAHERLDGLGGVAQLKTVGRHAAPTQYLLAFGFGNVIKSPLAGVALLAHRGQKNHTDPILPGRRQIYADTRTGMAQKIVGDLHQ